MSDDGSIVVGSADGVAFIWDAANGVRDLKQVLENQFGLDLMGWTLTSAQAITPDGRTIVGNGFNPAGVGEGWILVLPEPSTGLLLVAGLVALAASRRRGHATLAACLVGPTHPRSARGKPPRHA